MIPVSDYLRVSQLLQRLGASVPPGFYDIPPQDGAAQCNWIGSDDPSAKWASVPLNLLLPWMKPASVPHDLWWSPLYNDGSRELFERSNREFRENLDLLADDSFGWVWPRVLRSKLQDARHWEARRAYYVLMDQFAIWQRNAAPEPGPERMQA